MYFTFNSKSAILASLLNSNPITLNPESVAEVLEAPTSTDYLKRWAECVSAAHERGAVIAVAARAAAAADAEVAALWSEVHRAVAEQNAKLVDAFVERFGHRALISRQRTDDMATALLSPEIFVQLVRERALDASRVVNLDISHPSQRDPQQPNRDRRPKRSRHLQAATGSPSHRSRPRGASCRFPSLRATVTQVTPQ